MQDWKRILVTSVDDAVVPPQVVNGMVLHEVGEIGEEKFYLVRIKAAELIHHERPMATTENEYCLLSWPPTDPTATYRGWVDSKNPPLYAPQLFERIRSMRESGRVSLPTHKTSQ